MKRAIERGWMETTQATVVFSFCPTSVLTGSGDITDLCMSCGGNHRGLILISHLDATGCSI